MTTNHRPTLEAKKGRQNKFKDSIVHARNLPQNTQLKYRSDINAVEGLKAVLELKKEQNQINEIDKKRSIEEDDSKLNKRINTENSHSEDANSPVNAPKEVNQGDRIISENTLEDTEDKDKDKKENESNIHKESQNGSEISHEDVSEDEEGDDSDDEIELLKNELVKIQKEKESVKAQKQDTQKEKALTSNPLLNLEQEQPISKKSGWRQTTFSNRSASKNEKGDRFTTIVEQSNSHKEFLSKYIK